MGPRLRSRGMSPMAAARLPSPSLLQWGRGLGAAECSNISDLAPLSYQLQWGRGLGAAECSHRPPFSQVAGYGMLQWGRGLGAAEWKCLLEDGCALIAASMGPRLRSRGMGCAQRQGGAPDP